MRCLVNGEVKNLPDFLVVGTGKAGTTSLHHYLSTHNSIVLPSKTKETLFWQIISNPNKVPLKLNPSAITDFDEYLDQFKGAEDTDICGEVCPSYLYYYDYTIDNLKKLHPKWQEVKIIIILREPVSKIISQYFFVKNNLKIEEKSLAHALRVENERLKRNNVSPSQFYVDTTRYCQQVRAFKENFRSVKVFFYEDLVNDRAGFIKSILEYIGVNSDNSISNLEKVHNSSARELVPKNRVVKFLFEISGYLIPKSVKVLIKSRTTQWIKNSFFHKEDIDQETIEFLRKIFEPEIVDLERLLNVKLDFWRHEK